MTDEKLTGLDLLRSPFNSDQIRSLPKPTKKQTQAVKDDYENGIRCKECGQWHHPKVVHLDYVGHAAMTDRLLDSDPDWDWQPLSLDDRGLPAFDNINGLWIKLTVCGKTRLGYGSADGKTGGNAIKEIIGDALRNAAMRFGAALDLWHKGDMHAEEEPEDTKRPLFDDEIIIKESIKHAGKGMDEYLKYFKGLHQDARKFLYGHPQHKTNKAEAALIGTNDPFEEGDKI